MTDYPTGSPVRWHECSDPAALAGAVAQQVLALAQQALIAHGAFRLVLAGGGTPRAVYEILAVSAADWLRWHVYFGDERCLPVDDTGRNSVMARQAWLDRVPIPESQIHFIRAELGAEAAASHYREVIAMALPFDLVLLGMGEDGHTASLFPGQQYDPSVLVHAIHNAPKPPADRVSLGMTALNDANAVFVLVTGVAKHAALQAWKQGADLPVARLHGRQGVDVYLDTRANGD